MAFCVSGFALCILVFSNWFDINSVSLRAWVLCILFAICEASVIRWISLLTQLIRKKVKNRINKNI